MHLFTVLLTFNIPQDTLNPELLFFLKNNNCGVILMSK